ncbi:MAG: hypothetical protein M1831_002990 [Alyxoria varia]|nr:MAG: hypothetical protein M1831_002990 [Alyxoria varia]
MEIGGAEYWRPSVAAEDVAEVVIAKMEWSRILSLKILNETEEVDSTDNLNLGRDLNMNASSSGNDGRVIRAERYEMGQIDEESMGPDGCNGRDSDAGKN